MYPHTAALEGASSFINNNTSKIFPSNKQKYPQHIPGKSTTFLLLQISTDVGIIVIPSSPFNHALVDSTNREFDLPR
ncbi:hypothetical protein CsatA_019879 [Cannabis sativa]